MKSKLIPSLIVAGGLITSSANASSLQFPKSCESIMDQETPMALMLEQKLTNEAKSRVVYDINNISTGFREVRTCLSDLGIDIAQGIPNKDIVGYGLSARISPNCLREVDSYEYPLPPEGDWFVETFETTDNGPKICFGILYGVR